MQYNNEWEYAHTRLHGSFVRTKKNSLVYIERVLADGRATIQHMRTGRSVTCSMDNIIVDPIELGYVNFRDIGPIYISRKPMRRDWKQGIRNENVVLSKRVRLSDVLGEVEEELCKGNYPTLSECLSRPNGGAFCKKFSVVRGELLYKEKVVGTVQNDEPCLSPAYLHLSELLRESYAT